MIKYTYKAKDLLGKPISGQVEARDDKQAAKLLMDKQLIVLEVIPTKKGLVGVAHGFITRVGAGDITAFTRQLSTTINAGLPLTESLVILRSQAKPSMQAIIAQILADVEGGESFSSALENYPKIFSTTYTASIKAGETGGVLDKVLERLSINLEREQEFKGKVKSALIYPIIIVVGMIVVSLIMLIFVIPRMTTLYDQFDAELPLATRILIGVSDFSAKTWPFLFLLAGLCTWSASLYRKTPKGRRKIDEVMLSIPLLGPLRRQVILTELTRTLGLMSGSGVAILDGLSITANVVKNSVINSALEDIRSMVSKGFPIAYSFAKHPEAFPFILPQMVAVGEETGKMDEVLAQVSHVFEVESDQKLKALTAAIEPIIMIILGIGVAFLVISIILPIYNLTTAL